MQKTKCTWFMEDHWITLKSERELKIQSRLFPMMVLEMRLCFSVIETNISRHVPKYTPCLTMTWDETTLLKHLHSVANNKNNVISDFVEITISLDFKRWNYYWWRESTERIFKNLHDLMGTPGLITYIHDFFQSAWYYLSSDFDPPDYISQTSADRGKDKMRIPISKSFHESITT